MVFLHVGTALVVPTEGQEYVPIDGAVTVPYPEVPADCASAAVLESAMAVANTIAASFMAMSLFKIVLCRRCGKGH